MNAFGTAFVPVNSKTRKYKATYMIADFFFGGPHKNNLCTKLTHALIYLLFVWYFLTGKERILKSLDVNNFKTLSELSESRRSFIF